MSEEWSYLGYKIKINDIGLFTTTVKNEEFYEHSLNQMYKRIQKKVSCFFKTPFLAVYATTIKGQFKKIRCVGLADAYGYVVVNNKKGIVLTDSSEKDNFDLFSDRLLRYDEKKIKELKEIVRQINKLEKYYYSELKGLKLTPTELLKQCNLKTKLKEVS